VFAFAQAHRHKKSRPKAAFKHNRRNYFFIASLAALAALAAASAALVAAPAAAPAAEAEPAASEAAPAAAEASGAGAGATTTGAGVTTTGAGAAASSFLPQAARATAATIAAKTSDLFIFNDP
jgi:hypothetical protein